MWGGGGGGEYKRWNGLDLLEWLERSNYTLACARGMGSHTEKGCC